RDPKKITQGPLLQLEEIVALLPVVISEGSARRCILTYKHQIQDIESKIDTFSEDELNRAHSLYSYISIAYIRGSQGFEQDTREKKNIPVLPRYIASGWIKISEKIGRNPMLDYSDCVLDNWERLDKNGPISMDNLRLLSRFTGVVDEEHFFKTHVIIESEASPVIEALQRAFECIERKDTSGLMVQFKSLETCLFRLTRTCLPIMFASTKRDGALCDYYIFFHQLRPLIKTWTVIYDGFYDNKPRRFMGPSGAMSSVLPCIDILLGVKMSSIRLSKMLSAFEAYIPSDHRDFLVNLRRKVNARDYVSGLKSTEPHLVYSFNSIIDRVLDFRWSHFQFVKKYVIEQAPKGTEATGTGGTPAFKYLHQHITDTEEARIILESSTPIFQPSQAAQAEFLIPKIDLAQDSIETPQGEARGNQWEIERQKFWKVGTNGFLCAVVPPIWTLQTAPESCKVLVILSRAMPNACVANGPFRAMVEGRKSEMIAFAESLEDLNVTEAHTACSLLAYIQAGYKASGYARNDERKDEDSVELPDWISKPFRKLAEKLDRPARVSYLDLVLLNWHIQKDDIKGRTADRGPTRALMKEGRIKIVHRFLAIPVEQWFWGMHVAIEGEATDAIRAISNGLQAIRKDDILEFTGCLDALAQGIRSIIGCHPDPYPHPSRAELVLMRRLKGFIAPDDTLRDLACFVYSGHSAILPALFKFLGVKRGRHKLQIWRDNSVKFMPTEHRKFIGVIEHSMSARAYLKTLTLQQRKTRRRLHDVAVLEVSFNRCIEQLLRFCSRRSQLVCRCVPQEAQWFREVQMKKEAEHLTRSHCALLIGRKLSGAPTPALAPSVPTAALKAFVKTQQMVYLFE
ncbi:hypothetical protein AAMO2058_001732100, partial [Amorphochlora amoebiformis]